MIAQVFCRDCLRAKLKAIQMKLTIRPLETKDQSVWERMFQAYAEFYKTSVKDEKLDEVWNWIFDLNNNFWCDIALDKSGNTLGFTQYQLMHRSLSGNTVCYLSDLYVSPDSRGLGVGKALIDQVLDFARSRNLSGVRWLTQESNYTARSLYDKYNKKTDFILYSLTI